MAHFHYTDDVIVATFMSFLTWSYYHIYATDRNYRRHNRLIDWFEGKQKTTLLRLLNSIFLNYFILIGRDISDRLMSEDLVTFQRV